jgi:23S rRNA maturation-related 3'-5' exoribonuclease YhaM
VVAAVNRELMVAWVILGDIAKGKEISTQNRKRAGIAAERCSALIQELANAR